MLTSLRDKLLTVTKNVGLFNPEEGVERPSNQTNTRAGSGILHHYQESWCELHNLNETNAKCADIVAKDIESISKRVSRDRENISLINHIFSNSTLTSNISHCLGQVEQLYNTCELIERKLVELEDIINETEFRDMKNMHLHHLECYRMRKRESLQTLQQALEADYQQKLKDYDVKKKSQLEERQKVFQEAFKNDLETYRHLGTIPKVNLPKQQNGAILEEIELDFDQRELDRFFEEENGVL